MKYRIKLKSLLVLFFVLNTINLYSQEEHHNHDHLKYELGVANSLVYFAKEKHLAYGLHLHLVRNIVHTKFGIGIAYEKIFDDHKHNTLGLVGDYRPIENLHISLSPGLSFEGRDFSETKFAFHAETTYSFNLGDFHLGPLLEFAVDPEDYHFSLGLHIGYGF